MPMDLDEHDLYPPDHEELTPDVRRHRNRVVAGTALVVWGLSLLVERALSVDLETFWLGIGLAAIAGWVQHRRYNWFVAGALVTGLGIGSFVAAPLDDSFGASIASLGIAAGFAAVYVRYPRRSSWALAGAGAFALIAVGAFGIGLIGLIPAVFGRFLLPLFLIAGGVLLLLRHSLPPKVVKVGLAGLALSFVLIGATSVPDVDDRVPLEAFAPMAPPHELPALAGRTLILRGGEGDVELRQASGDDALVEVTSDDHPGPRGHAGLEVEETDDAVIIDSSRRRVFGAAGAVSYVLTLPDGVALDIERESGAITGELRGASGALRTGRGNIDVTLRDGGDEGPAGDGPYLFETDEGDVTVDSKLRLVLDVEVDDGTIEIDGEVIEDDEYESPEGSTGSGAEIEVSAGNVSIDLPGSGPTTGSTPATPETPTVPPSPTVPPVPN